MANIRTASLKKIEGILDNSYFTKDSFSVETSDDEEDFLVIKFIPIPEYVFAVSERDYREGEFQTSEYPGLHMLQSEYFSKDDFPEVIKAITPWIKRIKEELDSQDSLGDVDGYLNNLRASFEEHVNEEGKFNQSEIEGLSSKIDTLESLILEQAEKLETSEIEIKKFKAEFEAIKNDLPRYNKGMWYRVAGNKVVRTARSFLTTPEGRKLLADGVRKFLE